MKRFLNWYKKEAPVLAISNKMIFWFVFGAFTAIITKIIQSL